LSDRGCQNSLRALFFINSNQLSDVQHQNLLFNPMPKQRKSSTSRKDAIESSDADLVCVTGANGFLGAWIVKELLERGYRVRGTVRNTRDASKTKHLLALDGADERLELVNASLDQDDAFMDVFKGCKYVIHNASPFFLTPKDAQVRRFSRLRFMLEMPNF
jgi:hypothetical protein